ncbi:magnesium transporter [Vibrio metschnikovii]|nr:magnesium transporter [Vibrio metschnikovii]
MNVNVMKNTHSIIETAQVKQLNEFSRKLIQPRYREKWVEKLVKLSDSEIKFVLESLSNHEVSELFSTISANATGELLLCITPQQLKEILPLVAPKFIENAMRTLDEQEREIVLEAMPIDDLKYHREALFWPDESVGRHMRSDVITLQMTQTVEQAKQTLYEAWDMPNLLHNMYVVNEQGVLLGEISPKALLVASSEQSLMTMVEQNKLVIDAMVDQENAARLLLEHNVPVLPVVYEGKLVGFFYLEDAAAILEKETTEDAEMQGGTIPLDGSYLDTTPWELWKKRIVWLLVLFVAEAYTGTVLRAFEEQLEAAIALAFFIPLLIGTGGNSGTQITTTIIRAMAVGEVSLRNLGTVLRKELSTGTLIAAAMAVAAWIRAWSLGVGFEIGLVVTLTILAIVLWSALVSSIIPMVLRRLNIDPAVVSAPFIATLVDGTGLIIYFEIAKLTLPQLA